MANGGVSRAGKTNMAAYIVGMIFVAIGIYLCTITQINLLTGSTSYPDLGIGVPMALVGIVVVAIAQRSAKRKLSS